jgi:S1-C subfamily serine protease
MMFILSAPRQFVLLLLALVLGIPHLALALTASQVYESVKDSVVVIKAYDQKGKLVGLGSGVMLPSGEVVTNYHVIEVGVRYTVGRGKKATTANVKAGDPDKDLCMLSAPQGLELSLSEGIVS